MLMKKCEDVRKINRNPMVGVLCQKDLVDEIRNSLKGMPLKLNFNFDMEEYAPWDFAGLIADCRFFEDKILNRDWIGSFKDFIGMNIYGWDWPDEDLSLAEMRTCTLFLYDGEHVDVEEMLSCVTICSPHGGWNINESVPFSRKLVRFIRSWARWCLKLYPKKRERYAMFVNLKS